MGAEILAGAYSVKRGFLMHTSVLATYKQQLGCFELIIDSFGLYATTSGSPSRPRC